MRVSLRTVGAAALALCLTPTALAEPPSGAQRRRSPIVEVFEKSRDAVVNISTTRLQRVRSLRYGSLLDEIFNFGVPSVRTRRIQSVGSGFVVHHTGYIVTNAHVVAQASDIGITFADQRTLPARVVAVDTEHDLAVLKVDTGSDLPTLRLARSDDIMVGETVVAIGNPLGYQHTVTSGIVSALDRDLHFGSDVVYGGLIQTDAAINPGNSGGPLLNINAELIGINTAIRGDAQNVGFAIPVDRLWDLLPKMLDIERRQRVNFGLKVGGRSAQVMEVRPGSPAAKAGLQTGDRITRFNGDKIRDGIDYYVHLLSRKPGDEIRLAYSREEGEPERTAEVRLELIPPPDGNALASRLLGMTLVEFPPELRRRYELPEDVGLIVDRIAIQGPADQAGINTGDVILRVDRIPVPSLDDLGLALEGIRPGEGVVLEGIRLRANPPFPWVVSVRTSRSP